MKKLASVVLNKTQALDVAAISHAAGSTKDSESLRDIHIKFTDKYVQFGATNARIVAVRRGTYGEFGGEGQGTGIFKTDAKRLAQVLRRKQYRDRSTITLIFGDGYVEVNGHNVGSVEVQKDLHDRIGGLVDPYFEHRFNTDESATKGLPAIRMSLLARLAKSAGPNKAMASLREDNRRLGRWYFITPFNDSWMYVGAIMEAQL